MHVMYNIRSNVKLLMVSIIHHYIVNVMFNYMIDVFTDNCQILEEIMIYSYISSFQFILYNYPPTNNTPYNPLPNQNQCDVTTAYEVIKDRNK